MSYNLKQCTILRRYDLANHICVLSIWIMKLCCWIKSVPYLYQNADYFITLSWLPLNSFSKLIRCIYKCAYVKGVGYTEVKIDAKRRLARRFIWRYKRRQLQLAQRLDITISKNVKVYNKNFITISEIYSRMVGQSDMKRFKYTCTNNVYAQTNELFNTYLINVFYGNNYNKI